MQFRLGFTLTVLATALLPSRQLHLQLNKHDPMLPSPLGVMGKGCDVSRVLKAQQATKLDVYSDSTYVFSARQATPPESERIYRRDLRMNRSLIFIF
jgi:hypothetical protein